MYFLQNNSCKSSIFVKTRDLIKLLNVYLNHFPKHEKFALQLHIRQNAYEMYSLLVECKKKYHNKTTLSKLDIKHEQLRMQLNLAFELGYFEFKDSSRKLTTAEAQRKYTAISVKVNEVGAMIGGLIKQLKE